MTLQALTCPQCGSQDFEDTAWNTRRCRNCGTVSRFSDDRLRLEILVWACPRCGFNNEREVRFCAKCGQALLRNCPVCATETRSAAEFCENCGIKLDEGLPGPPIVEWLQHIKGTLGQYGVYPSMVATIAQGLFPTVFETCAEVVTKLKLSFALVPKQSLKVKATNAQTGEIIAMMGSAWTWPKRWTVRVFIQPNAGRYHGVAVICTQNYPTVGTSTPGIANQVLQAISAEIKTIPIARLM